MQRNEEKEGMENGKNVRNVLERLNSLGLRTNSSTPFLKRAVMDKKAMLFSTLSTARQNYSSYSYPSQTSKMEFSAKIINGSKLLTITTKCSILVV